MGTANGMERRQVLNYLSQFWKHEFFLTCQARKGKVPSKQNRAKPMTLCGNGKGLSLLCLLAMTQMMHRHPGFQIQRFPRDVILKQIICKAKTYWRMCYNLTACVAFIAFILVNSRKSNVWIKELRSYMEIFMR